MLGQLDADHGYDAAALGMMRRTLIVSRQGGGQGIMNGILSISDFDTGQSLMLRRTALATLFGGVALAGFIGTAQAEGLAAGEIAALQFALNLQYLTTNFLQAAIYGDGRQLQADNIRGGELGGEPGVVVTTAKQVRFPAATRDIQARVQEIGDEHWYRNLLLRALLRADVVAQKTIDLSPATFTAMFRLAGVIDAGATFDPYSSPLNLLLATETLISVQASVISAMLPSFDNDILRATMAAFAASVGGDAATIRSMLYAQGQAVAIDKLAAWRDRVDGTAVTDRGLSATTTNGNAMTRIAFTDADGLLIGRTPAQALNVLFMTSGAVTTGGFFPTGINGAITRSAAN